MKKVIYHISILILICFFIFHLERFITESYELRQLTKDRLRLEIQLLKIQIEINKTKLPKRTVVYGKLLNRTK